MEHILDEGREGPETFRFLRRFCGLTISEFADQLGVDQSALERWEAGDKPIPESANLEVRVKAAERVRPEVATNRATILSRLRSSSDQPKVVQITLNHVSSKHRSS